MSKRDNESNFSWFTLIFGVVLGSAFGFIIGVLMAPKSGTETRFELSENMYDAQNKTRHLLENTKSSWGQNIEKATKNLGNTVKRISEAFSAGRQAAVESINDDLLEDNIKS